MDFIFKDVFPFFLPQVVLDFFNIKVLLVIVHQNLAHFNLTLWLLLYVVFVCSALKNGILCLLNCSLRRLLLLNLAD